MTGGPGAGHAPSCLGHRLFVLGIAMPVLPCLRLVSTSRLALPVGETINESVGLLILPCGSSQSPISINSDRRMMLNNSRVAPSPPEGPTTAWRIAGENQGFVFWTHDSMQGRKRARIFPPNGPNHTPRATFWAPVSYHTVSSHQAGTIVIGETCIRPFLEPEPAHLTATARRAVC